MMELKEAKRINLYKEQLIIIKVPLLLLILSMMSINKGYGLEGFLLKVSKSPRTYNGKSTDRKSTDRKSTDRKSTDGKSTDRKSTDRNNGSVLKGEAVKDFGDKKGLLGIGGIELGLNVLKFERLLKKLQGRGFPKLERSKYYYKSEAEKFFLNGFEDKNILIKGRIITYKRHLEIKLLDGNGKKDKGAGVVLVRLSKLDKALKGVAIKFYDDKLYEAEFEYKEDLNGLNVLIEEYHRLLGAGSKYLEVTSTYSWFLWTEGSNYMVTLNFLGESFPRRVLIKYRNLREEAAASSYFHKTKLQIDKLMKMVN